MTNSTVEPTPPSIRQKRVVRILFAAALVALPIQVVVREVAGEPYPGLYQPSFGGVPQQGSEATTTEAVITLEFASGASRDLTMAQALPPTGILPRAVLARGFADQERADDPRTVRWLRERFEAEPEGPVTAFDVQWQRIGYSLVDGSRRVLENGEHVRVDFEEAP